MNLRKHSFLEHCGASVFIRVDCGNPIIIANRKTWVKSSVYKNYLGEPFEPAAKK